MSHGGVLMTTLLTMPASYVGQTASKGKQYAQNDSVAAVLWDAPPLVLSTIEYAFYHVYSYSANNTL